MLTQFSAAKTQLRKPWLMTLLLCSIIPLFPEYFAPFFAVGAFFCACYDAKMYGRQLKIGTVGKLVLIYIAYMTLGLLYSPNSGATAYTILMWVVMFGVYVSVVTVLRTRHRFDTFILIIALVAGIVGLIACVQHLLKMAFGEQSFGFFWGFADDYVMRRLPMRFIPLGDSMRVSSTFNNPNILCEFLIMAIPFIGYYAFDGKRTKVHVICRWCLIFAIGGVAFSYSRGGYIALVLIAVVFLALNAKKIGVSVLMATSGILLLPDSVLARLVSITSKDASIFGRMEIWAVGAKAFEKAPFFGIGSGAQNTWDLLIMHSIDAPHMHNLAIQLLVEGGIFALAIFVLLAFKALLTAKDLIKNAETRMLGVAIVAFGVGFITHGMFDFTLMSPKLVVTFLSVIAVCDSAKAVYLEKSAENIKDLFVNPANKFREVLRSNLVPSGMSAGLFVKTNSKNQ